MRTTLCTAARRQSQHPPVRGDNRMLFYSTTAARREAPGPLAFDGYASDALNTRRFALRSPSAATLAAVKSAPPAAEKEEAEDRNSPVARARIVFGSKLGGPSERRRAEFLEQSRRRAGTWMGGVLVPPRPEEPDNCCMSGCAHCVWDEYREEMEGWAEKKREGEAAVKALREKEEGGGMAAALGEDDLFDGIPVGIVEFMKTEKKLKEQQAAMKKAAAASAAAAGG